MNLTESKFGVTLTGALVDFSGNTVIKQKFHVYDDQDLFLAYGKTSSDGRFKIELPSISNTHQKVDLIFRLCEEKMDLGDIPIDICRDKTFSFMKERSEVGHGKRLITLDSKQVEVGEVRIEEVYEKEQVPLSYLIDIASAVVPATILSSLGNIKERIDFCNLYGIEGLQNDYQVKKIELTEENTWKLLTNGICPIYFKKSQEGLIAEINWDKYEFDKLESLPNIRVFFNMAQKESPKIEKIEVQFRKTLQSPTVENDREELKIYQPKDTNFEEGLRIANSCFHVFGQTVYHLAIGHVYGAKVAQAVHDYLQGTKLGELLLPHCQFIRKISNELGKGAIFGEDGILNVSALSIKGIAQLINDTLAALDPFSFQPREPINEAHLFAKAQKLHYRLIRESVKEFFDLNWSGIVKNWTNINLFFLRLHKTSPTFFPWSGEGIEGNWQDNSEMGGCRHLRVPVRTKYDEDDKEVRSMRWIAKNMAGPEAEDREMIELFSTDFIHHVTLWHSWIHRSQYAENSMTPHLMDVNFSPITLEKFGVGPFGGIREADANQQLQIGETFRKFPSAGYALVNAPNVFPGMIARIRNATQEYLSYGINPLTELQVSTVI